jgi:hypothetical protein
MGTIKIKKDGKEYIEGLIVDQAQDTRLYLKTSLAPTPYTLGDGIGYSNSSYGNYDKLTNVWSLNLPLFPPGSEQTIVIPNGINAYIPGSSFPTIDSDNNRRGMWAICTLVKADESELTLNFANGDDELAPEYQLWDTIFWPSGSKTIRVGIWMWNGEKWKWFGRSV